MNFPLSSLYKLIKMKRRGQITFRLPEKHKNQLIEIAEKSNCSLSDVLNSAVSNYLQFLKRQERREQERQQKMNKE